MSCANHPGLAGGAWVSRMRRVTAIACFFAFVWCFIPESGLSAAAVPPGFSESPISGPWSDAVGMAFEENGRMYVWERTGRVWFKDPSDTSPSLLLDIGEEVGAWEDHGMLGLRWTPTFG